MSTLSKIFVVLNLVLSIVFAVFVTQLYKHSQNWKQKHADLEKTSTAEIKKRDQDIQDLIVVVDSLKGDLAHQRDVFFQLQGKLADKENEIQALSRDKLQLQDANRSLTQENNRLITELSNAQERARQLEEERKKSLLVKDAAVQEMERALDSAHETGLKNAELNNNLLAYRERIVAMSKELEQSNMILQEMRNNGLPVDRYLVGAPPLIEGRVKMVQEGVVMISVGSEDGVREGYEFSVYRGDHFLCKIRIDKAYPTEAAGWVMPDTLRPDDALQVNDHVTTRF